MYTLFHILKCRDKNVFLLGWWNCKVIYVRPVCMPHKAQPLKNAISTLNKSWRPNVTSFQNISMSALICTFQTTDKLSFLTNFFRRMLFWLFSCCKCIAPLNAPCLHVLTLTLLPWIFVFLYKYMNMDSCIYNCLFLYIS